MSEESTRREKPNEVMVGFVTAPPSDAERIAGALLDRGLAACCNVVGSVTSVFNWEGVREKETESLIIIKTTRSAARELTELVKEIHPYDLPEVILLDVREGLEGYLKWVVKECARGAKND